MEKRFDRIDAKLDSIDARLAAVTTEHHARLATIETQQKGILALCLAIVTAALSALAKALHLV